MADPQFTPWEIEQIKKREGERRGFPCLCICSCDSRHRNIEFDLCDSCLEESRHNASDHGEPDF